MCHGDLLASVGADAVPGLPVGAGAGRRPGTCRRTTRGGGRTRRAMGRRDWRVRAHGPARPHGGGSGREDAHDDDNESSAEDPAPGRGYLVRRRCRSPEGGAAVDVMVAASRSGGMARGGGGPRAALAPDGNVHAAAWGCHPWVVPMAPWSGRERRRRRRRRTRGRCRAARIAWTRTRT